MRRDRSEKIKSRKLKEKKLRLGREDETQETEIGRCVDKRGERERALRWKSIRRSDEIGAI